MIFVLLLAFRRWHLRWLFSILITKHSNSKLPDEFFFFARRCLTTKWMALTFSAVIISVHGLFPLIGYRKSELCVVKDIVTLFCLHPLSRVASLFNSIYLNANTDENKEPKSAIATSYTWNKCIVRTTYIVHSTMQTLTGWLNFASSTI